MKILPLVNTIKNDVALSGMHLRNVAHDGIKIANRTAKVYHHGNVRKYFNAARSISDKVIKNTKREDIPYIAGAIGMMLPIPLTCPLFIGLGYILRFSFPDRVFEEDFYDELEKKDNLNMTV